MNLFAFADDRLPFPVNYADIYFGSLDGTFDESQLNIDDMLWELEKITASMGKLFKNLDHFSECEVKREQLKSWRRALYVKRRAEGESMDYFVRFEKNTADELTNLIRTAGIGSGRRPAVDAEIVNLVSQWSNFKDGGARGYYGRYQQFKVENVRKRIRDRCNIRMKELNLENLMIEPTSFAKPYRMKVYNMLPKIAPNFPVMFRQLYYDILRSYSIDELEKVGDWPFRNTTVKEYIRIAFNYYRFVTIYLRKSRYSCQKKGIDLPSKETEEYLEVWDSLNFITQYLAKIVGFEVPEDCGKYRPIYPNGKTAPEGHSLSELGNGNIEQHFNDNIEKH